MGAVALPLAIAGSSILSSNASSNAANTQAAAANNATATQLGMFNQTQANLQPYMQAGNSTLSSLLTGLGNGSFGGTFNNTALNSNLAPNYNFMLNQGQQSLQNSQAAKDGVLSGAAMKDLLNYNQGMAGNAYQQAFGNWLANNNQNYSQLMNLVSLGQNSAAGLGNTGANYANSIGNNMVAAGNASAAGMIGSANAISGGINNMTGYYMMNNMLNGGGSMPTPTIA